MSSASEPPYPPGRQGPQAALPARHARALPAAPSSADAGGDEADATLPGGIQRVTQAGAGGSASYQGMTAYPGQGNSPGHPQGGDEWFGRTNAPPAGQPGRAAATQVPGRVTRDSSRPTRDSSRAAPRASTPRAARSHFRSRRAAT